MSLVPDLFTAQRPRCPYSDEPVLVCMSEEKSDVYEQNPEQDGKGTVRADLVPDIPEDDLDLDGQQVEDEQENEPLVVISEFLIILFERIDAGNCHKQGETGR